MALEAGAADLGPPGPDDAYGHGRLDVLAAYEWLRTAPDLVVGVSPPSAGTLPGGTVSYPVSLAAVNGFDGEVTLSATGLPAHATWEFAPSVVPGGAGSALLTVNTAASSAAGTYPFMIRATSGATVRTASATLVVLAPPDFTLSASPSSRSLIAGGTATYPVGVAALSGFSGEVGLSVSGLPAAVGTAAFSPPAVAGAGTSQLTVTTLPGSPGGTFPLTITGSSGQLSRSRTVSLVVTARDFTVTASPATVAVSRRQTATYSVTLAQLGGPVGPVTLAVAGLPAGATASASPNPAGAPGTSTLMVRTGSATPRGTFGLTVTGTAGALVRQASVQLQVG